MEAWNCTRRASRKKYQIQGISLTYNEFGQEKYAFALLLSQYIYTDIIYKQKHTFLTKTMSHVLSCIKLLAQKHSGCTTLWLLLIKTCFFRAGQSFNVSSTWTL